MSKPLPLDLHGGSFLQASVFDEKALSHAFFGRRGGVSSGVYTSLNVGSGSNDDARAVESNRRFCAEALGADPANLVTLKQVHSAKVITVEEPFQGPPPEADALVTQTPGIAIGVLAADCMPLLFADFKARVIGAAHAGWRGALDGVIEATIDVMTQLGAAPYRIKAALGPCLRQENFEVGLEFVHAFQQKYSHAEQFFTPGRSKEKRQFDAPAFARDRLRTTGVKDLIDLKLCTVEYNDLFFSYRAAKKAGDADYGRNLSAIMLRK